MVTGQIVADLSMPVSARGIDLLVTGYEKAEWHNVSNESESDPNGGFKHFKKAVRHRGERNEQQSTRGARGCQSELLQMRVRSVHSSFSRVCLLCGSRWNAIGKKTFFTNKQRIYNIANGIMMPGQHTFPFR